MAQWSQGPVRSVDGFMAFSQYDDRMRRIWLTLLTAFALAASGASPAMACPMDAVASAAFAQASAHDCCPDGDRSDRRQGKQTQDQMDGCLMGMACRTAPAVAPTLAPIAQPNATIPMSAPAMSEPANLSGPLQELFRPPRTV